MLCRRGKGGLLEVMCGQYIEPVVKFGEDARPWIGSMEAVRE